MQPWRCNDMSVRKPGHLVLFILRIPIVFLILILFFLLAKSSLSLISGFAVPFGFSAGTTTVFSIAAVTFYTGIAVLICLYLFKPGDKDN